MKTWYHVLRHPQTTNEKRANAAYLVDEEIKENRVKARLRNGKSHNRLACCVQRAPAAVFPM